MTVNTQSPNTGIQLSDLLSTPSINNFIVCINLGSTYFKIYYAISIQAKHNSKIMSDRQMITLLIRYRAVTL